MPAFEMVALVEPCDLDGSARIGQRQPRALFELHDAPAPHVNAGAEHLSPVFRGRRSHPPALSPLKRFHDQG